VCGCAVAVFELPFVHCAILARGLYFYTKLFWLMVGMSPLLYCHYALGVPQAPKFVDICCSCTRTETAQSSCMLELHDADVDCRGSRFTMQL